MAQLETYLVGLNTIEPQSMKGCNTLENWTYDIRRQAWTNGIGFEPYLTALGSTSTFIPGGAVLSVFSYQRHNGAQTWLLLEQGDGKLYYLNGSESSLVELSDDRSLLTTADPQTSYEIFGRYVILTNSYNRPIKYRGGNRVYDLGWYNIPNPPAVMAQSSHGTVNPGYHKNEGLAGYYGYSSAADYEELAPDEKNVQATQGLGSSEKQIENKYHYKVTLINEAGSESPISAPSRAVTWESWQRSNGNKHWVAGQVLYLDNIPTGPSGTVARRIYRTKRLDPQSGTGTFYYVETIHDNHTTSFYDHKADTELGAVAPSDGDSVLMPAREARFSASYKNVLFLDGGRADPSRLYYSQPLQPDTFRIDNVFDVGTRIGGDITGLYSFNDILLVFRENAIDYISGDPVHGFSISNLRQGIGTKSPHSITSVPGVGIVFLSSNRGIYAISVGSSNTATGFATPTMDITKISSPINDLFDRVNQTMLPRACAAYSAKFNEWHCYLAVDGHDRNNLGIVLHLGNKNPGWSTRTGFPVGCLTTDYDGNLVFGSHSGAEKLAIIPSWNNYGLFVVSNRRIAGVSRSTGGQSYSYIFNGPVTSTFRSPWIDFGAPNIKKKIRHVTLMVKTRGDNGISMKYYKDRRWADSKTTPSIKMQRTDHVDQPVYGTAKWDTAIWEESLITPIRFDISDSISDCFAFEIETSDDIIFVGYVVDYSVSGQKSGTGKR